MDNAELYRLLKEENRDQNKRFDTLCGKIDKQLEKIYDQMKDLNGRSRSNSWNVKALWAVLSGVGAVAGTVFGAWVRKHV